MLNQSRSATVVEHPTRVHSYVIDHDVGFAPNPFQGFCTLAACKPDIRLYANEGDYVIGTGSRPNNRQGYLIYWMHVDEVLTFDEYWSDPRFRMKRPNMRGSFMLRYGDNIYHHETGSAAYVQVDSFHSEPGGVTSVENLERDTGRTDRVLIAKEYAYWGGGGPRIPDSLMDFVHTTQGRKSRFPPNRVHAFVAWIRGLPDRGLISDPTDWPV